MSTPKVVTFGDFGKTDPNWLQSKIVDPKILIPGGVRLALAPFSVAPFLQPDGRVYVPGGTAIYRSLTDRANNIGYRPLLDANAATVAAAITDHQISVTLHDRWDLRDETQADGLQPSAGNLILENFLPNQAIVTAAIRRILRQAGFVLILGRE